MFLLINGVIMNGADVQKSLRRGMRDARNAVIKDGKIFINDIVIMPDNPFYTNVSLTVSGARINLSDDPLLSVGTYRLMHRVYKIANRRNRIRAAIQQFSDKITHNKYLDCLSDDDICSWFALERIRRGLHNPFNIVIIKDNRAADKRRCQSDGIVITRVGYMFKIYCGNVALCHIPADEKERRYILEIGEKVICINDKSVPRLYARAEDLFFGIYSQHILPHISRLQCNKQRTK